MVSLIATRKRAPAPLRADSARSIPDRLPPLSGSSPNSLPTRQRSSTTPAGVVDNLTRASTPGSFQSPLGAPPALGSRPARRTIPAPSSTPSTDNRNCHTAGSSLQPRPWLPHTTPDVCGSLPLIYRSPTRHVHTPMRSPPALDGRTAPRTLPVAAADETNPGDGSDPSTHSL